MKAKCPHCQTWVWADDNELVKCDSCDKVFQNTAAAGTVSLTAKGAIDAQRSREFEQQTQAFFNKGEQEAPKVDRVNTKPCPKCDERVSLNAARCRHCGTNLVKAEKPKRLWHFLTS